MSGQRRALVFLEVSPAIWQNKRVLLFKEMLEASHYPDKTVADDLARGFNLVGHLALPEGWTSDFRPATFQPEELDAGVQRANCEGSRQFCLFHRGAVEEHGGSCPGLV